MRRTMTVSALVKEMQLEREASNLQQCKSIVDGMSRRSAHCVKQSALQAYCDYIRM